MWCQTILLLLPTVLLTIAANNIQLGKTFNVFAHSPSLNIKVISGNRCLFLKPTQNIFTLRYERVAKLQSARLSTGITLCDNIDRLLQAYFSDFHFEGMDNPWKVFTASWSRESIAKYMGIDSSYMDDAHYSYVLVRLPWHSDVVDDSSISQAAVSATVLEDVIGVEVGNVHSVMKFIQKFGTHYLNSFIRGDSLYQVIIFSVLQHMYFRKLSIVV